MLNIHDIPDLIGLDTSALFALTHALEDRGESSPNLQYLSGEEAVEQYCSVIQRYAESGRLIIPSFVAIEYDMKRPVVWRKTLDTLSQWSEEVIDVTMKSLRYSVEFDRDISYIDMEEAGSRYRELVETFHQKRRQQALALFEVYHKRIQLWIESALKEDALSDEDVKGLNVQAQNRYAKSIPPGYCDNQRNEGWPEEHKPSLPFYRKFGDFYVWEGFLRVIERENPTSVGFVTSDMKEDWWVETESSSTEEWVGRVELSDEVRERVESCSFRLMTPMDAIQSARP